MSDQLSIREVMICWTTPNLPGRPYPTSTAGMVELVRWPDRPGGRSDAFDSTSGACILHIHKLTKLGRQHFVMSTALGMILNYGMDSAVVHRALWPLQEYRDALPPDTMPPQ